MPTDPASRVTCAYHLFGHYDFGLYVITPGLASALGLPGSPLIGGHAGHSTPSTQDPPGRRLVELAEQLDQCGLASAVWAQYSRSGRAGRLFADAQTSGGLLLAGEI